ncbi:ABC transporter ATP-binding protein [Corallococcus sp. H22C18031201]|uniref:ABC transporter ATP-binding protein n=1 Tax=Citreicoccus inhibens TaxID=2849499 RepID=UPI000E74A7B0|nr:ABC transporter ATP-binding protein [Citreicoccus inhibens]MBJ6765585.1 ABC transporter ATP-binding protein [Myxococcaceae bacterium JPH2]MBU8894800.1 ABC transporter ATP-binding protein [Citreicoccus inhibens]RJS17736.1 ABC transporter ATP-binding protein [Corallococcus sp. H22C18031201]
MIDIVDLHKTFGEHRVLTGINLTVPAGSTCVILGGSGSGKTVLMKHMIGLLKPDSGQVIIDGEDIVPVGVEELQRVRRKFGMVFQAAALFDSMTVYENVAFPLREHTRLPEEQIREKVRAKLDLMGLKREAEQKFPADLSGGMRKRVGLARAIVLDPKVVLYDEPTTGLDPITTDYVDEMILAAQRELGVTSVVISHDIASAFNVADQIAFLSKGVIVEHGPPEQLRASEHPAVKVFLQTWFGKN